ncbi:hypothetical protein HK102_009299 [Quaeritorhiza haematococci]|nr:hypothetical protein HK102_009299 [Quaeritorhiza haematococci]
MGADPTCNPANPPLAGSREIFGPSWRESCNQVACHGYFPTRCPAPTLESSKSAFKAVCASCPGGKNTTTVGRDTLDPNSISAAGSVNFGGWGLIGVTLTTIALGAGLHAVL